MKAHKLPKVLMSVLLIGVLMTCTQAWGTVYTVDKNCAEFGHINQHSLDRSEDDWLGGMACAPTATMNSFIYLQSHYPTIYDNLLVPAGAGQDVIKARELALNFMNTSQFTGTTIYDWAWGKHDFLEQYAPGKTIYHGQTTYNGWDMRGRPDWALNSIPSWDFLYNQLFACQDVEIGIWWDASEIGHALTLCGMSWNDATNSGTIDFIDPWDGVCYNDWALALQMDGKLHMNYAAHSYYVDLALAESAVPEPSAFLMLGSGFVGILIRLRRRRV